MFSGAIDQFIGQCNGLSAEMGVSYSNVAPTFVFSNTGRRGDTKYFSITLGQLIEVLQDIINNHPEYFANVRYVEKNWRDLFSSTISNQVVNALSTVQTLPLFELINKVIMVANGLENHYKYKEMDLTPQNVEIAKSYLESQLPDNDIYLFELSGRSSSKVGTLSTVQGRSEIYYGAPGTGKSHTIDEQTVGARKVVTVFHPDTQHSDFVGALKPVMDGANITYQFRPGPFTRALIEALTHTDEHVYLIIEEINRAPAAAVFGELFQLLDRKDGASKYDIDAADPDMLAYINTALAAEGIPTVNKLTIPSNLSLLATMNSSDQAVMPLDTAFKRRWSFRYIKIDFSNQDVSDQTFRLMTSQGPVNIGWRDFADKVINHHLKGLNVPEDRLLGPFFLSETELSDEDSAKDALCGKLFVYLWDDVLRHRGRDILFVKNIRTFGELHDTFLGGKEPIFQEDVDAAVYKLGKAAAETEEPEENTEDA